MKKQVVFYVVWDVLFFFYLFLFSTVSHQLKLYVNRTMETFPLIGSTYIWLLFIGGFFAWLVYTSHHYPLTKKSAVLELILVGLPAFYLSSYFLPFIIQTISGMNIPWFYPFWLARTSVPMSFGVVLFGYELFIFAIRLIKVRKGQRKDAEISS